MSRQTVSLALFACLLGVIVGVGGEKVQNSCRPKPASVGPLAKLVDALPGCSVIRQGPTWFVVAGPFDAGRIAGFESATADRTGVVRVVSARGVEQIRPEMVAAGTFYLTGDEALIPQVADALSH